MRFYPRLTILVAMPVGAQLVRNGSVTVAVGYHVVHVLITVLLLFVYPYLASPTPATHETNVQLKAAEECISYHWKQDSVELTSLR